MMKKLECPVCGGKLGDISEEAFSTAVKTNGSSLIAPTMFIKCHKCKAIVAVWQKQEYNTGTNQ